MVFGICEENKELCFKQLSKRIGNDVKMWRWRCKHWTKKEVEYHEEQSKMYNEEKLKRIMIRKEKVKEMNMAKKYINENIHLLSEDKLKRFMKVFNNMTANNHKGCLNLFNDILKGNAYN